MTTPMSTRTKRYRYLALSGFIGLFSWMLLWYFVFTDDSPYSATFILLVYVLPLVFPASGIIRGRPYTHAWANFIVLFYLMHGITALYASSQHWIFASIEILLATIMFVGCAMYARLRGQELGIGLKKLKDVMAEERERFEGK
ncbi:DUF2069 domain-containing protein [Aestuariibacter salexigens]|uniref:DUF2069 domain-containing protein n=1 Tax=Aestuariibacter salexigens TaxID=226010 RepID=UPI001F0B4931|nr:DUF2069 domain-containing protein [Aestuariibacter salexigens]